MTDIRGLPLAAIILTMTCPYVSDSQTTASESFAEVTVADHTPVIPEGSPKVYSTSVRLRLANNARFEVSTFTSAAARFYADAFTQGFLSVTNVQKTDLTGGQIQVSYDVTYIYPLLFLAVSGSDAEIQSTIGSFAAVRLGLNAQPNILAFYPVTSDESAFSFGGSRICDVGLCNGTYVTCTESTTGLTATCVSQCKAGFCYNQGICFHTNPDLRPTCRCPAYPDLWVLGERCETKFPLWLAILLALIGFLLILVVIFIVCMCLRRKRRRLAKKQALLNSEPKSYISPVFQPDDYAGGATVASDAPPPVLAREDSFETVTSSEMPPSEYRPPAAAYRGRGSRETSVHSRDTDRRRRRDDKHKSRRRSTDTSERESERPKSPSGTSAADDSSSGVEADLEDPQNISFYEVDVNDSDINSDTSSHSVAVPASVKSSPIRWLPPKSNEPRAGWVPSLGPAMYDLPTTANGTNKTNTDMASSNQSLEVERRRMRGTDV